jgi:hypothetical protein
MMDELCINIRLQRSGFGDYSPRFYLLGMEDKLETFLHRFLALGPSRVKTEYGRPLEPRFIIKSIIINIDPVPEDGMAIEYDSDDSDDIEDFVEFFTEILFDLNEDFEVFPGRVGRLTISLGGEKIRDWNLSQILASNNEVKAEGSRSLKKRTRPIKTYVMPRA